ncbi:MAG: hypothetical protein JSR86_13335 [Proteobacteria bacterium]|nr:hypothetical protein [Pseudomonadota bacterium]
MTEAAHRGLAEDDPRNRGPIDHFRPLELTEAHVRRRLERAFRHDGPDQIEARVQRFLAEMAAHPPAPPPPLSQPLEAVADPWMGMGARPDLIEQLWRLETALPSRCRWVVWGRPALVRPDSGVVFAIAVGTIGIAARLPPALCGATPAVRPTSLGEPYDNSTAGPEWHFLPLPADEAHALAAYAFAADPASP